MIAKVGVHGRFGGGVHGRGGLVEYQDIGTLAHIGPRQGDLLPLATGELLPPLEPASQLGVVTLWHGSDEIVGQPATSGFLPARLVLEGGYITGSEVLADLHLVAHEVLEDDPDASAKRLDVPFAQVVAIEQDSPRTRLIEAGQQLDQGGLA